MLSPAIIQKIQDEYSLTLTPQEKVKKGSISDNYILTDGTTNYFLKKYVFNSQDTIKGIHASKKFFSDGGIPVILPIPTKTGGTFFATNDSYYTLFPFIAEKQIERGKLSDTAIISLGKTLARMHLLGKNATLKTHAHFKPWEKQERLKKIDEILKEIGKKKVLDDFDKSALEDLNLKKNFIETDPLLFSDFNLPIDHLVHGDYVDHNVFFTDKDEVAFVFDFEKTTHAPRVHELIRSIMYSFFTDEITEENIAKVRLYLHSYLEIYPMSQDEILKGLKLFLTKACHSIWIEDEHYLKNNARTDEFLVGDLRRIKYLAENLDSFAKKILS